MAPRRYHKTALWKACGFVLLADVIGKLSIHLVDIAKKLRKVLYPPMTAHIFMYKGGQVVRIIRLRTGNSTFSRLPSRPKVWLIFLILLGFLMGIYMLEDANNGQVSITVITGSRSSAFQALGISTSTFKRILKQGLPMIFSTELRDTYHRPGELVQSATYAVARVNVQDPRSFIESQLPVLASTMTSTSVNQAFEDENTDGALQGSQIFKEPAAGSVDIASLNNNEGALKPSQSQDRTSLILVGSASSLGEKIIVIDPGHGSKNTYGLSDPGAIGPTNLYELADHGAKVIYTRTGDTSLDLFGRAQVANDGVVKFGLAPKLVIPDKLFGILYQYDGYNITGSFLQAG